MTDFAANFTLSEPETINAVFKVITVTEATGLSYNDLDNRPSINDVILTGNKTSTDLGLAAQSTTYTKNEVDTLINSIPTPDVSGQISAHNTSNIAHSDIRTLISNEVTRAQSVESTKADKTTTYTKTEVDSKISAIPTPDVSAQITSHNSSETAHSDIRTALSNKVGKSGTKQLSDENYTNDEKTKLSGIEAGAQVNPDLTSYAKTVDVNTALCGKSDTSHNHTLSGLSEKSYNSLADKPTIPTQYTDAMAQSALSAQLATKVDKNGTQTLTDNNLTNALKTSYDGAVTKSNIIVLNGDGSKYLADDGLYKTVESGSSLTEAQQIILANTSGTNTGDETTGTLISKLGSTYLTPTGDASNLTNYNIKNLKANNVSRVILSNLANQPLTANILTKINLTTEAMDSRSEWDASTARFTPSFSQQVLFTFNFELANVGKNQLILYKDGSGYFGITIYGSTFALTVPFGVLDTSYYEFYLMSSVSNTILSSYNKVFIDTLRGV